ncbi:MAG: type II toxin-antitoxin system PemK/MazF family toxin [Caldilineales bacterium]|nr:type II toxin-antitoxin system PemK/MazF family toxin [Caldilineales bacterium]
MISPKRAHLYWAQAPYLPERPLDIIRRMGSGEVQAVVTFKARPVLVVQNHQDNVNPAQRFVLVAGVHSIKPEEMVKLRRVNYPTDLLLLPGETGLQRPSVVFLNQLLALDKNLVYKHIGSLSAEQLVELNVKLTIALGLLDR